MELATKKTLADTVEWVKVSGVAWQGDGFYYSRYPAPAKGQEKASINENHQVYFHKVGTPQAQDTLVHQDPKNPQRFHIVETTDDERFAILTVSERGKGKDGNALYVRDLSSGQTEFVPIVSTIGDDSYGVVDNVGGKLIVQTNRRAPNWRVVLVDPARPDEANWTAVLPEKPEPIDSVNTAGGKLFATYLKDVMTRAYVYSLSGTLENEVALPGPGSAAGFGGPNDATFVFYSFNSLNVPPAIYRYDIATPEEHRVPPAEGAGLQRRRVRDQAGLLHEQGRHPHPDVPRPSQRSEARRQQPDLALCLRRLQRGAVADVQRRAAGAARAGIRVRLGEPAGRRRVRRVLAPAGDQAEEAERLRRLSSRRPSGSSPTSTRRRRSWPSRADRTADCWSAP